MQENWQLFMDFLYFCLSSPTWGSDRQDRQHADQRPGELPRPEKRRRRREDLEEVPLEARKSGHHRGG